RNLRCFRCGFELRISPVPILSALVPFGPLAEELRVHRRHGDRFVQPGLGFVAAVKVDERITLEEIARAPQPSDDFCRLALSRAESRIKSRFGCRPRAKKLAR